MFWSGCIRLPTDGPSVEEEEGLVCFDLVVSVLPTDGHSAEEEGLCVLIWLYRFRQSMDIPSSELRHMSSCHCLGYERKRRTSEGGVPFGLFTFQLFPIRRFQFREWAKLVSANQEYNRQFNKKCFIEG